MIPGHFSPSNPTVKHQKEENNHIHTFSYNQPFRCYAVIHCSRRITSSHAELKVYRSLPLIFYIHTWDVFDTRLLLRPFFMQVGNSEAKLPPLCQPVRNGESHVTVSHCRPLPCFKLITFAYRANLHYYYVKSTKNPNGPCLLPKTQFHSEICNTVEEK